MRSLCAGMIVLVACVAGASSPGRVFAESQSSPGRTQGSEPTLTRQTTTFGTVGIVAGQTVRLSAVRQPDEDPGVTVCRVDLSIFDIHGTRQATASRSLDPGKGAFLDVARADIAPPVDDARAQVYAVVDVTSNATGGKPSCQVARSVEVFDQADGRSRIFQGSVDVADGEPRNVAPPGSRAQCLGPCTLADAACPAPLECWANPLTGQFLCCNGRP